MIFERKVTARSEKTSSTRIISNFYSNRGETFLTLSLSILLHRFSRMDFRSTKSTGFSRLFPIYINFKFRFLRVKVTVIYTKISYFGEQYEYDDNNSRIILPIIETMLFSILRIERKNARVCALKYFYLSLVVFRSTAK